MKSRITFRVCDILTGIPDAFNVQPAGNYQAIVSHSSKELTNKAWRRTGKQMSVAMLTAGKQLKHG